MTAEESADSTAAVCRRLIRPGLGRAARITDTYRHYQFRYVVVPPPLVIVFRRRRRNIRIDYYTDVRRFHLPIIRIQYLVQAGSHPVDDHLHKVSFTVKMPVKYHAVQTIAVEEVQGGDFLLRHVLRLVRNHDYRRRGAAPVQKGAVNKICLE